MPIDFNTPDPLIAQPNRQEEYEHGQAPKGASKGVFILLSLAVLLSSVSLFFSYRNIGNISVKSPIIIQCDPSVQEDLKQINLKMQQINTDIWGK